MPPDIRPVGGGGTIVGRCLQIRRDEAVKRTPVSVVLLVSLCVLVLAATLASADYLAPWSASRHARTSDLEGRSNWTLTLMRNEIYARHGRPFDNSYIRSYFNSQGWYSPDSHYSDSRLNSNERYNADFIRSYQIRHFGSAATKPSGGGSGRSSGGGSSGQIAPWTASRYAHGGDLFGHSNWQLTLMRNEIYARHGRPFDNSYIRAYFRGKSWYHADSGYSDRRLNRYERTNAEFIKGWQADKFGTPATRP
jgi:hypothetical protein